MRRTSAGFTALILGLLCTAGALAEKTNAPVEHNLAGVWTVHVHDRPECEFGGQAILERSADGTSYSGELTMRHDCPEFGGATIAVQKSEISVLGNQVSVRSRIIDFPTGNSVSYAPDNFALTIKTDQRLFGIQTDRYGTMPAEWKRQEAGIS